MYKALLFMAGVLTALCLAFGSQANANATTTAPSQQVIEVSGNGDLEGNFTVPAGVTRFWVIRLDGNGTINPHATNGFRAVGSQDEDQLAFESAASNSAPIPESVELTVGVHHDEWSTTRLMLRTEIGGKVADGDSGKDPWFSTRIGVNVPISAKGNGTQGGLSLTAVKPLSGAWVGLVEVDPQWEGSVRGSSLSGSDWQTVRFGFGFGQHRPYGLRWDLGAGVDFGQYGIGAERPLYAKARLSRTALPGQPWEAAGQFLGAFGPSGAQFGGNASWDLRLMGWWTVGLDASGRLNPGGEGNFGLGPALGCDIPTWGQTLRFRTGAHLGAVKDSTGKVDGSITPFLQVGLQKGN